MGEGSERRGHEEEAADFCLRALRADDMATVLDDAVATAARVLGCELVRVVQLTDDGDEVVAVSGAEQRAQVFVEGAGSGVEVPIPGRTRPFGVLGAYSKTARGFPPADVGFLQVLAATAGHAVERLRGGGRATADVPADAVADSVVHDLNNLLTIIAGNVELLLDSFDAEGPRPPELEAIEQAAQRAEALVPQVAALVAPSRTAAGSAPPETRETVDP